MLYYIGFLHVRPHFFTTGGAADEERIPMLEINHAECVKPKAPVSPGVGRGSSIDNPNAQLKKTGTIDRRLISGV